MGELIADIYEKKKNPWAQRFAWRLNTKETINKYDVARNTTTNFVPASKM
jgi:hypothetical protein